MLLEPAADAAARVTGDIFVEAAMTILEHPEAQTLLADAELSAASVRSCADRLTAFAQRYLPLFYRKEHRVHALTILGGKLSGLQRKTTEPIARQARHGRRNLQLFVGAGGWDDAARRDELRRHVRDELADPAGVFILDPSAFPKKGDDSCGVTRQWCGCLGKVDNCHAGVFLAYVSRRCKALHDARLYLDEYWGTDAARRSKTYVPDAVPFKEKWRIGRE